MNYVLSFCKVTAASKIFSRNFYLPLLKPLTPKDALRTFRITGKWLLGSKRQHYIPVLLNHTKKRSKKEKNYGKIKHEHMKDFVYMMPILDPDNIESHKNLIKVLNSKTGKGAFVYSVNDKNYNLVVDASLEIAIRNGDVIDVLMSQGTDKILIKLSDFKKIPVEIQTYVGKGKLYKGEGTTTKEDERHHHHGKHTMSIAKIFEEKERKEEKWEEELKRLLRKRKRQHGEGTKEWNEMIKGATANMDWKKYEQQAKRIVQYVEEPIVEYYVGMEVDDYEKTNHVEEVILKSDDNILNRLPTLQEIPELINNMSDAVMHEYEVEMDTPDGEITNSSHEKIKRKLCGAKIKLSSEKECFVVGQMIKTEEGDVFVPGQTVENEFGVEYAPGITINIDKKPALITGLIVGESDNKNPMFVPLESTITEAGHLSFTTTHEERVKYKPRKVPVRKVIKSINQNPDDNYEEYYYDEEEEEPKPKKKLRRVVKRRKIIPPGCEYNSQLDDQYEEEEYSEYEEIDDDDDVENLQDIGREELVNGDRETSSQEAEEELTLEEIIERHKKAVDPRTKAHQEIIEEERLAFKVMDAKITELIVNIEVKTVEVKEKLEELRNLTVVQEIEPISTAGINDAVEIAMQITNHLQDANAISEILLTMVRRIITFPDRNSVNIENINNPNIINQNEMIADERSRRCEKLKIALKTAMVAANNVFKNRPKDEVSALKAIGTVLILALQDQDKLITELCYLMDDPMDRNEICALLLKELSQKHKKNKLKTLKSIIENEKEMLDESKVVDKLKDVLEKKGDIIGPAFKKIAKNNSDLLRNVIDLVKCDVGLVKTERTATQTLQDAIVKAVKQNAEKDLMEFVNNAESNDFKEFIAEAVGFSHVLGLNGVTQDLLNLPLNSKIISASDKTCLTLLKRMIIIRKLAKSDNGQTAALYELRKHPEYGKTNPRIRQLVRESAGLISNSIAIKNSKQIPAKLLEEENIVALEDFLIQKSRIDLPVMVSKDGKEAVIPQELAGDVLDGRVPYVLVDEDGVSNIKAVKKFNSGIINNSKDFEKSLDDYSPFGTNDRNSQKKNEKWAEVPNFGKMDVRNRLRRLSNYNRVTA